MGDRKIHIDNLYRERQEPFAELPPDAWKDLEKTLDSNPITRPGQFRWLWYAAMVGLVAIVGYFSVKSFISEDNKTNKEPAPITSTANNTENKNNEAYPGLGDTAENKNPEENISNNSERINEVKPLQADNKAESRISTAGNNSKQKVAKKASNSVSATTYVPGNETKNLKENDLPANSSPEKNNTKASAAVKNEMIAKGSNQAATTTSTGSETKKLKESDLATSSSPEKNNTKTPAAVKNETTAKASNQTATTIPAPTKNDIASTSESELKEKQIPTSVAKAAKPKEEVKDQPVNDKIGTKTEENIIKATDNITNPGIAATEENKILDKNGDTNPVAGKENQEAAIDKLAEQPLVNKPSPAKKETNTGIDIAKNIPGENTKEQNLPAGSVIIEKENNTDRNGGIKLSGNNGIEDSSSLTEVPKEIKKERRSITDLFSFGVKGGYELGTGSMPANKSIIGGFIGYNISNRLSFQVAPAIRSGELKDLKIPADNAYYRQTGTSEIHIAVMRNGFIDSETVFIHKYDSILVSYKAKKKVSEFEIPISLNYNITNNFYAGLGINFIKGNTVSTLQETIEYKNLQQTDSFSEAPTAPPIDTSNSWVHSAAPYSTFTPETTVEESNPLRTGYMLTLGYKRKYWLIEMVLSQTVSGLSDIKNEEIKKVYSQPYLRFMVGIKLGK
jgi:hypothetical protein